MNGKKQREFKEGHVWQCKILTQLSKKIQFSWELRKYVSRNAIWKKWLSQLSKFSGDQAWVKKGWVFFREIGARTEAGLNWNQKLLPSN